MGRSVLAVLAALWMTVGGAAVAADVPDRDMCEIGPKPERLVPGENCRHVMVHGVARDYFVVLPYPLPDQPVPVVFVFQPSDVDFGLYMMTSGWRSKANDEAFIAVFPHALSYRVPAADGIVRWSARWQTYDFDPGDSPRPAQYPADAPWPADDLAFVDALVAELSADLPVDMGRIYATGFGASAGAFVARLAHDRPAVFAATAVAGAGYALGLPADLPPAAERVPMLVVLGNQDPEAMADFGGNPVPLDADALVADDARRFAPLLRAFDMTEVCGAGAGTTGNVLYVRFCRADGSFGLLFALVQGLAHLPPDYINNPGGFVMVSEAWDFFDAHKP